MALESDTNAILTAEWRDKARAGVLSDDEMRRWITACRQGRATAAKVSAASKSKKAPINVDSMLDELDNL